MKKPFKNLFIALPIAASLALASCGGEKPEGDNNASDTLVKDSLPVANNTGETEITLEGPGELLKLFKKSASKNAGAMTFLEKPGEADAFTSPSKQALNFGIYACDLSFCTVLGNSSGVAKYFVDVKKLGDKIGVSTVVKPEIKTRLEANAGNADSLILIVDDLYYSAKESLEQAGKGPELSLVVAGGYLESLYILTNIVKYEKGSPAVLRLMDERFELENIIAYMKKYESDANVAPELKKLEALKIVFDEIHATGDEHASVVKKDGHTVLEDHAQVEISAEQYKHVQDKIKEIRNSFVSH